MSWKKLQAEGKVRAHKTSKKELDDLRAVILRDLEDAAIQELSDDRRFATAYNAALQTATMSIACAGFRLATTPGHHRLTLEVARLALGPSAHASLDFFEACRRKRNVIDYDHASRTNLSQSEHDWAFAKRSLARGEDPEEVIRQIAQYRASDKHDPVDYARRTVTKAQSEIATNNRATDESSLRRSE